MRTLPNAGPEANRRSRQLFVQYLEGKNDVLKVAEEADGLYFVERRGMSALRVLLVDIYTVSVADVSQAISDDPNLSAIVTASAWNSITPDAKAYGANAGVGVFSWKAFMGAVHRSGRDFLAG